jgi:hypothetical protein
VDNLEKVLRDVYSRLGGHGERIAALEAANRDKDAKIDALEKRAAAHDAEVPALANDVKHLKNELKILKDVNADGGGDAVKARLDALEAGSAVLNGGGDDSDKSGVKARLLQVETDLVAVNLRCDKAGDARAALETTIDNVQSAVDKTDAVVAGFTAALDTKADTAMLHTKGDVANVRQNSRAARVYLLFFLCHSFDVARWRASHHLTFDGCVSNSEHTLYSVSNRRSAARGGPFVEARCGHGRGIASEPARRLQRGRNCASNGGADATTYIEERCVSHVRFYNSNFIHLYSNLFLATQTIVCSCDSNSLFATQILELLL